MNHDPRRTIVLANDISEGPDFARLAGRGFPIYVIYHVDVVAYVAAMYGRSRLSPETLVRWYDHWESLAPRLIPDVLKLVFEKQRASVLHSRGIIVPSDSMRDILHRCYPDSAPGKVHVLPWGVAEPTTDETTIQAETERIRTEYKVPREALVLLTLSRISPEKGQDLLLEALLAWESSTTFPNQPVWLFLCGEAAFMQGQRFMNRLKHLAASLRKVHVIFPGYVIGARKQAFFRLAHLYVFPSRHESYGLTLLEALHAGLPAICLDHYGARAVMRPEFGQMVSPAGLQPALARLAADPSLRKRMGAAARAYAADHTFSTSAAKLAELLMA